MRFNRFHKTLLALIVVLGPLYWLTLTDDGQRRVDSVLLSLAGKPGIDFNLKALDGRLTEAELHQVFPELQWRCQDQASAFGQRLCAADIGSFNGLPARYLAVFFADGRARALKLGYRNIYHDQLLAQLVQQLGRPPGDDPTPAPDAVLRWDTGHGTVVMKRQLLEGEEAALLWLAGRPAP